ncbi:MAG: glycine cleavage system aminomethyltransferase GcvT [Alphaproteobacteria bacterium]
MSPSSKQTPLHDLHVELGAKMAAFAGYTMPISYPLGVMKEHLHCRESAGLFDVCHMGQVHVEGVDVVPVLERLVPADISGMEAGQCKYSFLLNENAGFIDDLIINRLSADKFIVVVNGACKDGDLAHMKTVAEDFKVDITMHDDGLIALQGPKAEAVLEDLGFAVSDLKFMHMKTIGGLNIARSGYTGEDGFEISAPADQTEALTKRLLAHDAVEAIGLGARDSLRLEAGLPLYGQDLTLDLNPVEASMLWSMPKARRATGGFIGADAFTKIQEQGVTRKRIGFKPSGRAPVRAGALLYTADGEEVGVVTSGGFGPNVGGPITHAYIQKNQAVDGQELFAEVRGKKLPGSVAKMPFVTPSYKR